MQFAELMKLFREGQNEGRKKGYVTQGACDAEGIAAVVRALRDETAISSCACKFWLDDILGAAGDEAAGSTPEGVVVPCSAEGEPPASPAAAPAPAVCEWAWERPSATSYYGWYRTSHGERTRAYSSSLGKCIACGKPIKFTEAK